jgi:hypothetical protein
MLMRVRQLQMELKYDEALQVIDQILFMDPTNPAALALRDVLESTKMYRQWADAQRQRNAAFGQIQLQDMQSTIPPKINLAGNGPKSVNAVITYPEDWPKLSFSNEKFPPVGMQRSPEDQAVDKQFDQVFDFPETTSNQKLSEVLDFCHQAAPLRQLEGAGRDRHQPGNRGHPAGEGERLRSRDAAPHSGAGRQSVLRQRPRRGRDHEWPGGGDDILCAAEPARGEASPRV